jgi:hypothetical protein
MTNSEYRIDLNPPTNIEEIETTGEEIVNQVPPTPRANNNEINNDHLHQFIHLLKENLTSTFPFALILILKGFYEHSAGIYHCHISRNLEMPKLPRKAQELPRKVQELPRKARHFLMNPIPFYPELILFFEGILMVVFFSASIYHANTVLVHQAALKVRGNSKMKGNCDEYFSRLVIFGLFFV